MRLCAPHLLLSVLSWGLGRWHGCKVVAVTQIFGLPTGKLCACIMPVLSVVWHNGEAVWCHCKVMLGTDIAGDGKGALLTCMNHIGHMCHMSNPRRFFFFFFLFWSWGGGEIAVSYWNWCAFEQRPALAGCFHLSVCWRQRSVCRGFPEGNGQKDGMVWMWSFTFF